MAIEETLAKARLLDELLSKYQLQSIPGSRKPNLFDIPTNRLVPTEDNMTVFNEFYQYCLNDPSMHVLERTKSGGISVANLQLPAFNVQVLRTEVGTFKGVELVICTGFHQIRIDYTARPRTSLSGRRAFLKFEQVMHMKKFGVDITQFKISKERGLEIKQEIPKPFIFITDELLLHMTFENTHHIDFHSSYAAGLANTHPEFREPLHYMFNKRRECTSYKEVLNLSIGYLQSKYVGYQYSHLAKDAITDNNRRVAELANRVNATGDRMVLLFNTDGFWYVGPEYHGDGEGEKLGQWHNDHHASRFRVKSAGAYEFEENGTYYPVVRGLTNLDHIKPREEWQWGDIYKNDCKPLCFMWDEEKGIVKVDAKIQTRES